MNEYLKLFQSHAEYEAFVSGGTMEKPNVSHCIQENEVHYNKTDDLRLVVKYYIAEYDVDFAFNIYNPSYEYIGEEEIVIMGSDMFDKIEIDGVNVSIAELDAASGQTQFSTEGVHTVKYTLKDPTRIPYNVFYDIQRISEIEIPSSVVEIDEDAFGNDVYITGITCNAIVPPRIFNTSISITHYPEGERIIYVPSESVEAYVNDENWKLLTLEDNFRPIE